ncbi:pentapeptide repeat-containing protein [Rhodococcus sp. IEGM 1307]|uniref:pentapeptide repeat-containing protein n=1 Tax=Rhodococcus sp. IEGM 1307 TaxID=3047091 RepID=UPI0024B69221|nr:pentapeptide repeat-containing protein [Rhodococcus sp. IEGM 1307]MDI9980117.1 pentapeptide repeat-containing protein [Rhodococcus sp. IEGM 1307]
MKEHGSEDATPGKPASRSNWKAIAAVSAAMAITYGVAPLIFWVCAHDPNWADFWRSAATPYGTMTAGYAAITAAAIAFQNGHQQRTLDKGIADREHTAEIVRDLRARFSTATRQLGDEVVTIQQAGAYALASLADDWIGRDNHQEAQVCIDVLCTYLRTHHLTTVQQQGLPHGEQYNHTQQPPDQPVRDTITRIINDHTGIMGAYARSWSEFDFDLTGAHLHNIDFGTSWFKGAYIVFNQATFTGTVNFLLTRFDAEYTSFEKAVFAGKVKFDEADFTGEYTEFRNAIFDGENVTFKETRFDTVINLENADFNIEVSFQEATIGPHGTIKVDWAEDPDSQPQTVTPRPWPQHTATAAPSSPEPA